MAGRLSLLIVALALLAANGATAQSLNPRINANAITTWTSANGFVAGDVWKIAQDREGYLWLGTSDGLVRFDGNRFETRLPTNARISSLLSTRSGDLWMAFVFSEGVTRVSQGRTRHYTRAEGLAPGEIRALLEDKEGTIWAGGAAGLSRFREERWERLPPSEGWNEEPVYSLYEDRRGALWIATHSGLLRRQPASLTFEFVAASPSPIVSIAEDAGGSIWVSDPSSGPRKVERAATLRRAVASNQLVRGRQLLYDRHGNAWIATATQGLFRGRPDAPQSGLERLTSAEGLNDTVWCLFEDREGLRAGTKEGLARIVQNVVVESFADDFVHSVTSSRDGSLWVGTEDGVKRYAGGQWRRFGSAEGVPGKTVLGVHGAADGSLWIGTSGGPAHYVNGRFEPLPGPSRTLGAIYSITTDQEGGVWFADYGSGIFRWKNGTLTRMTPHTQAGYSVFADRSGRVWMGFSNPLVVTYYKGELQSFTEKDGLASGAVNTIYQDSEGNVWIGSKGGITLFRDGGLMPGRHTRLSEVGIASITEDLEGFLWLGTSAGLIRIRPPELTKATDNSWAQARYVWYDLFDGLPAVPLRRSDTSAARDASGRLWFINGRGVFAIDPNKLSRQQQPATARIDALTADSRRFDTAGAVTLPPGTSSIQVDYTALSLSAQHKLRFRYKLDGLDRDWVDAQSRRQAFFTNLEPGSYRFHVAATEDGAWSGNQTVVDFSIRPMFYQTSWFAAGCGVMIILAFSGASRMRIRQMHKRYSLVLAERARMGRDLHDTLLQGLFGIALQLDAIVAQWETATPDSAKGKLLHVRRQVEQYMRETRHSIWNLRPPSLLTHELPTALRTIGEDLTAVKEVGFDFEVVGKPRPWDTRSEDQLLRLGEEAISNAVRHSGATQVHVQLRYEKTSVRLNVTDNGRGFDRDAFGAGKSRGFGLITMRERADQIGGRLDISSSPIGTSVTVVVPAKSALSFLGFGRERHLGANGVTGPTAAESSLVEPPR